MLSIVPTLAISLSNIEGWSVEKLSQNVYLIERFPTTEEESDVGTESIFFGRLRDPASGATIPYRPYNEGWVELTDTSVCTDLDEYGTLKAAYAIQEIFDLALDLGVTICGVSHEREAEWWQAMRPEIEAYSGEGRVNYLFPVLLVFNRPEEVEIY